MSKKSRRRNRRLALLGALGAGLMLAGRGRGDASVSTPTTIQDSMPRNIGKKITDVYPDAIMRGGKGVKQGFKTTSANVQRGLVDPPGLLSQGNIKFDKPMDLSIKPKFEGSAEFQRKVLRAKKDAKRNDMLRAIRSGAPVQQVDPIQQFDQSQDFGFGVMAKDGGRIVKGEKVAKLKKKKSIQIRGFGKARRG